MEIFKICLVAIIICVISIIIKQIKPEYFVFTILVGGITLLIFILNYFTTIFSTIYQIVNKTGLNNEIFKILLKIIGVGYVVEFTYGICVDSGNSSIADKVLLCGKIIILIMALPIINSLFEIVLGLI